MHSLNLYLALIFSLYSAAVQGIPTWDMFTSRSRVSDLVPGTTIIHAYGPTSSISGKAKFLRSNAVPGLESNITVTEWVHNDLGAPSKFFVSGGGLFQITNQTSILYGNLLNATDAMALRTPTHTGTPTPENDGSEYQGRAIFRLGLSTKREGLTSGSWEWVATMLQYRVGEKSNNGLFYKCVETNGDMGVYVPLDIGPVPNGCEVLSLISYTAEGDRRRQL